MKAFAALFVAGSALALAACAGNAEPDPVAPAGPPPVVAIPVPVDTTPKDACGAWELRHLVGRHRSEIPVPLDPGKRRVACTTCPVTMDFRADRLNIFFDAKTGVIEEVKCG